MEHFRVLLFLKIYTIFSLAIQSDLAFTWKLVY